MDKGKENEAFKDAAEKGVTSLLNQFRKMKNIISKHSEHITDEQKKKILGAVKSETDDLRKSFDTQEIPKDFKL
jgi:hypothetical protein